MSSKPTHNGSKAEREEEMEEVGNYHIYFLWSNDLVFFFFFFALLHIFRR
jgi:hypothetical protein